MDRVNRPEPACSAGPAVRPADLNGGWPFQRRGLGRTARMHVPEESDSGIVPMNHSNKEGKLWAENEEGRPLHKENIPQPNTHLTQSGARVSQGLRGVRKAAREHQERKFTALLRHLTVDLLRESFYALKRKAASAMAQFARSPCTDSGCFVGGGRRTGAGAWDQPYGESSAPGIRQAEGASGGVSEEGGEKGAVSDSAPRPTACPAGDLYGVDYAAAWQFARMPSGVGRAAREDEGRIQRPRHGGAGGPEPHLVGRRSPIG